MVHIRKAVCSSGQTTAEIDPQTMVRTRKAVYSSGQTTAEIDPQGLVGVEAKICWSLYQVSSSEISRMNNHQYATGGAKRSGGCNLIWSRSSWMLHCLQENESHKLQNNSKTAKKESSFQQKYPENSFRKSRTTPDAGNIIPTMGVL